MVSEMVSEMAERMTRLALAAAEDHPDTGFLERELLSFVTDPARAVVFMMSMLGPAAALMIESGMVEALEEDSGKFYHFHVHGEATAELVAVVQILVAFLNADTEMAVTLMEVASTQRAGFALQVCVEAMAAARMAIRYARKAAAA